MSNNVQVEALWYTKVHACFVTYCYYHTAAKVNQSSFERGETAMYYVVSFMAHVKSSSTLTWDMLWPTFFVPSSKLSHTTEPPVAAFCSSDSGKGVYNCTHTDMRTQNQTLCHMCTSMTEFLMCSRFTSTVQCKAAMNTCTHAIAHKSCNHGTYDMYSKQLTNKSVKAHL